MKVLILNGSPRKGGNTDIALREMKEIFAAEGIGVNEIRVGGTAARGCIDCGSCRKTGQCVFDDVHEAAALLTEADGVIAASPVYFAQANASLAGFLTRLLYSYPGDLSMKVGASVVVARRGGCSAAFDELNKFFTISNMPLAPSQYWNSVHGLVKGDAEKDLEGLQTMRTLARNMVFLMKSIALGKEQYGLPEREEVISTHFIR